MRHIIVLSMNVKRNRFCTSFRLFKEWKQFIVKKILVLLLISMWIWQLCTFEKQDFTGLLRTSTGEIWRQCMRELNKSKSDHYASLTFWRFHSLSRTLIFTLNMIYRTRLLWHDERSHYWTRKTWHINIQSLQLLNGAWINAGWRLTWHHQ